MSARVAHWLIVLLTCCGAGACAGTRLPSLHTGAAALSSEWQPIAIKGATVALRRSGGGEITASISCDKSDQDASLDVLTNHLLFDLEARHEVSRQPLSLDGRAALRTRLRATLDGVAIELDLVVLKKDGCVVDVSLVAAPPRIESCEADFARFLSGLAIVGYP